MPNLGPIVDMATGAAKVVGGVAKIGAEHLTNPAFVDSAIEQFKKTVSPMSRMFEDSKVGTWGMEKLQNQYFPEYRKNVMANIKDNLAKPEHLRESHEVVTTKAAKKAQENTFGQNNSVITNIIHEARAEKGDIYAANLADHFAMVLKDNHLKYDVKYNKEMPFKELNLSDVYKRRNALEAGLQAYNSLILAPFIAIPHLSNIANTVLTTPLGSVAKGISEVLTPESFRKSKAFLMDSGILSSQMLEGYREVKAFQTGKISKIAGAMGAEPKTARNVGSILNRIIHTPGFNEVRTWTLVAAGSVGKINAERMAERFAKSGGTDKRAAIELTEMGLNLKAIMKQGGKLETGQLEQAIYRYTDNKVFLDNQLNRSFYSGSSPLFRSATMFHGFVTRQGALMRHEFIKAAKSGDPALIGQFLLTAGVAFPLMGEGLKQVEEFARGQSPDLKEDIEDYKGGGRQAIDAYLDSMAHMASFGIWASYSKSAARMHIANTFVGVTGNQFATGAEDTLIPLQHAWQGKSVNLKPLGRDVLQASLPFNLGKILSHRMLPTPKETKARSDAYVPYKKPKDPDAYKPNAWKKEQ